MQKGTRCQVVVSTSHVIGYKILIRLYTTWATICGHRFPSYVHANGVDAPNFIDCAGANCHRLSWNRFQGHMIEFDALVVKYQMALLTTLVV